VSRHADGTSSPAGRRAAKGVAKAARKHGNQPLESADWEAYFRFAAQPGTRFAKRMLNALPSDPRCGYCGAPFSGIGARIVGPLGYRPSRKNPNLCSACVESAPPGGTTMEAGVLFADLRGFTTLSESMSPEQSSEMLRRFYTHAQRVLFPEALIDKLIGDEVMALYVPHYLCHTTDDLSDDHRRRVARVMVEHARKLLADTEFALGIGLDFGEVFIGNIGDEMVRDFTAIGDVVNTASRLQGHAAAGDIVLSARLGDYLDRPPSAREELTLKGKSEPVGAYRISAS
jgi:adenylate cyclase